MREKIVLIDGHSILNRAFFGIPDLTNSEGLHTNGIYGFLNILFKILEEESPEYLVVAFDVNKPTFRHEMYEAYKGTRKESAQEFRQQVPVMKDVLRSMNIKLMEEAGLEADDLIGTIAKWAEKKDIDVSVISGDRDLLQLASDRIKIRIPKTKRTGTEIEDYLEQDVIEKYKVTPTEFIDLKALMGDASDNIPGVPGIGEKTASKIIEEFKSIENAYKNIDLIKPNKARENLQQFYDQACLSKVLATIKTDCTIDFELEDTRIKDMFNEEAYLFMKRLEFKNILNRFQIDVSSNETEENFELVIGSENIKEVFQKATSKDRVAFQFVHEEGHLIGLVFSTSEDCVYFMKSGSFEEDQLLVEEFLKLSECIDCFYTFSLKEQLKYLSGFPQEKLNDLGIAAYLISPMRAAYEYEEIGKEYLGLILPDRKEFLGKSSLSEALLIIPETFLKYVCYSGYVAIKSIEKIMNTLSELEMKTLYEEMEMPLLFVLYHMERVGIKVEKKELKEYGDQLQVRILELEKEIYSGAGEEFNINSPKQLGVILFEKLQMPYGKKTKTGFSTSAEVLEKLAAEFPFVDLILEYRQLVKLKSTYADGLANYIEEDNRIHSRFQQTIAATGRISSIEPNLQNIPIRMELGRLIRKVFVPEEGYVFVDADYSQIELRVLAHMSEDVHLIKAYVEAKDIHRMTASEVFHIPFDEVTSLQRRNAKAVNFGIVYGISSFGLSQDLSITRKEAAEYIEKYFDTYPSIKSFLDGMVAYGKENGFVKTLYNRRRPIPELSSSNFMQRSFGERVAMNSPIQGTAADIIKIAMIKVHNRLEENKMKSRLILQVHDELLIEAHESELEEVKKILEEEMVHAADLSVPLEIDMHEGKNWYETK